MPYRPTRHLIIKELKNDRLVAVSTTATADGSDEGCLGMILVSDNRYVNFTDAHSTGH
jgi:hypothetical protein